jgi:hypothetical protein
MLMPGRVCSPVDLFAYAEVKIGEDIPFGRCNVQEYAAISGDMFAELQRAGRVVNLLG